MSRSVKEIRNWLRESTFLDAKMELVGHLYDGTPLDKRDVRDVITEVAYANIIHLVKTSTELLPVLMREMVYIPEDSALCLSRVIEDVPVLPPLNLIPNIHRRIAAEVFFTSLHIYSANVILFSHVPRGKFPDWDKRFEGTIMEGMEDQ